MKKTRVAVVFGGRNTEHEVSLVSAGAVIKNLDREKFELVEIGITKEGKWLRGEDCLKKFKSGALEGLEEMSVVLEPGAVDFDIVFPVLHGPFGEDGTIQGFFEMLDIPYVGDGVLGSALAMDKVQAKIMWEAAGLPVVPYVWFLRSKFEKDPESVVAEVLEKIGIPCFVKPANMGSSIGVMKVKREADLLEQLKEACKFDRKILVEKALRVRELECAVLGNEELFAAPVGEVVVGGEFYDFNDKYLDGKSYTEIPAKIPSELNKQIQDICVKAFQALDCSGLARVDGFLDLDSDQYFLNELNTMPGFTMISLYPKAMEDAGIDFKNLVTRLIELGMERHEDRKRNLNLFDSGSDWFKGDLP